MTPPPPPPMVILPAPEGVNHGPGLLALSDDNLLACWYSGRSEAGPDVVILCARSTDAGAHWAVPRQVSTPGARAAGAPRPAKSVGNVALARDDAGRIVMIVGEIQSRRMAGIETCRTWRCGRIDFRVSTDDGLNWSTPTRLDDRPGALPRGRPLRATGLGDLIPVYQEAGWASVLRLDLATLTPGRRPDMITEPIPGPGPLIQPALVEAPAGRLLAFLRDPRRRFVHVSERRDGVWTRPRPTHVENPGSAVDAFRDIGGRIALIHNPGRRGRGVLAVALSDDGVRFGQACALVPAPVVGEAAYPSVTELGAGVWGMVFSIAGKRQIAFLRIGQDFLDRCAASEPGS